MIIIALFADDATNQAEIHVNADRDAILPILQDLPPSDDPALSMVVFLGRLPAGMVARVYGMPADGPGDWCDMHEALSFEELIAWDIAIGDEIDLAALIDEAA